MSSKGARRVSPSYVDPTDPRPLQVGEYVLCTLRDCSADPPQNAVVVSLDDDYKAAAAHFAQLQNSPNRRSAPDHKPSPASPTLPTNPTRSSVLFSGSSKRHARTKHVEADPHSPGDLSARDPIDLTYSAQSRTPAIHTTSPQPNVVSPRSNSKRRCDSSMTPTVDTFINSHAVEPSEMIAPHPITVGRVYVHFSASDRRLDRWANASELERASASTVAAAASGVVANTLLDNPAHADFGLAAGASTDHRKLTRSRRRMYEKVNPTSEREVGNEAMVKLEKLREEKTKVRNISYVVLGEWVIDAWYYSPFPPPFSPLQTIYMCRHCLKYVRTARVYREHCTRCIWDHPPGFKIYDHKYTQSHVRVYEIDSVINPDYCQRLCLLAKLFLDHKTLFCDVSPFLMYVLTINGHLAGFFSKENPVIDSEFNLACILTLPPHQKKGVGRFLIALSYELTKRQNKTAAPERPLSDLGQVSYRSYWDCAITQYLDSRRGDAGVSAKDIAEATGIRIADVSDSLKSMNLVCMFKSELFADTSPKAIDAALQKVSRPRLPLLPRVLKGSYHAQDLRHATSGHTPNRSAATTPRDKRVRAADKVPLFAGERQSIERKPFTQRQLQSMADYVRRHTPEVVDRRLDSEGGLDGSDLQKFADEIGLEKKRCRKKLKAMAQEMVRDPDGDGDDADFDAKHIQSPRPLLPTRYTNGMDVRGSRFHTKHSNFRSNISLDFGDDPLQLSFPSSSDDVIATGVSLGQKHGTPRRDPPRRPRGRPSKRRRGPDRRIPDSEVVVISTSQSSEG